MAIYMFNGSQYPNRSANGYPDDVENSAAFFVGLSMRQLNNPDNIKELNFDHDEIFNPTD